MKKSRRTYTVAVVGATGAVGTEMLRVLEERRFPVSRLVPLASARSAGRRVAFNGSHDRVAALTAKAFHGVDIALFSAGALRSLEFAPEAVKRGAIVVDNSSAFRMEPTVPLVVPEVNPEALKGHQGLIANPNCSTIILLVALAPLHRAARLSRIVVATYQAVSGAGAKAMWQLLQETRQAVREFRVRGSTSGRRSRVEGRSGPAFHLPPSTFHLISPQPPALPAQIAFNVIPQVDVFLPDGSTKEETKLVNETRKILGEPRLRVSATCVRVPVFVAHSEAVWIQTEQPLSPDQARIILRRAPGVTVVDRAAAGSFPMPIQAAGRDEVLVGRIRRDPSIERGLALWISGDNLRKGAATNAVQLAELLLKTVRE